MSKNEVHIADKAADGMQTGNAAVPAAKKGRMARILDTIAKYTFFPEDFPCLGCGSELELDRHHLCRECALYGQLQKAGVCLQIPRCNLRSRCHGAGYCRGVRFCLPRGYSNKRALKTGGYDTERIQSKP